MQHSNLFIALTRPVAFAGLPMMYLSLLIGIVQIGFIVTGSFLYLIVSGSAGYGLLRALAAYDPKLVDVIVAACRSTPMSFDLFTKKGMTYRA